MISRIDHATRRQLIDLLERLGGGMAAQGTGWEESLTGREVERINHGMEWALTLHLKGTDEIALAAMNRHHASKAAHNSA